MNRFFLALIAAGMVTSSLYAEVLIDVPLKSKIDLQKGWLLPEKAEFKDGAYYMTMPEKKARTGSNGITIFLDAKKIAGKRVRLTVEVKKNLEKPFSQWQGGKLIFSVKCKDRVDYHAPYVGYGKTPWTKFNFTADITQDAVSATLFLGIEKGNGTIAFRNLKLETLDTMIDLRKQANMGFVDKTAGDGKGGWSDQGPENDAGSFSWKKTEFNGIPFSIINPDRNNGKSVITFASQRFSSGSKKADIDLSNAPASGKYIYLMHTLCFHYNNAPAGTIMVYGSTGKKQKFNIFSGRDINNWWRPVAVANATPIAMWQTPAGGLVGAYGSRFTVDPELGKITRIVIEPDPASSQIWIVMAMTISDKEYRVSAAKKFVQKAENGWKVLPVPKSPLRIKGSALDLSWLSGDSQVGDQGRLIINKQGHYAFEKNPQQKVRFLSTADAFRTWQGKNTPVSSHENTEKFVEQVKMHGYNMIRLHFIDAALMVDGPKEAKFGPEMQDRLDYLAYLCKKNNIYLNWDVMSSRIGYEKGDPWGPQYDSFYKQYDRRDFKSQMYYERHVRQNWEAGAREFLDHVNPYTKTAWKDDPILAMALGFNEQEFSTRSNDCEKYKPAWHKFLREKYKRIEALNKVWKTSYTAFDVVPVFTRGDQTSISPLGRDAAEFLICTEVELGAWYLKTIRGLGFKGPFTNYNMEKSFRYHSIRKGFDFIAMNNYFCHPSSFFAVGSVINQISSISNAGNVFRGYINARQSNKPYHITESGHVFWNQYRYEQSFVTGAYASFQDFDAVTGFSSQIIVNPKQVAAAAPFAIKWDPLAQTQEFLTAMLFRRGDVDTAKSKVRLQIDTKEILDNFVSFEGIDSRQSRLALTIGFSVDCDAKVKPSANEVLIDRAGGAKLLHHRAYTDVLESNSKIFDPDVLFKQLKEKKLLPADNQSSYDKEIYESSTKELFMDVHKNYMTVNTPRTQGMCGEAGAVAKLADFEVKQITTRGNIAATSVDGMKPLNQANRIVIVYATNVLNSGMEFEDSNRVTLVSQGKLPLLVQTGKFSLTLKNKNAAKMKAFALRTDGFRMCELPLKKNGESLELNVDTATLKCGPALYFELAEK